MTGTPTKAGKYTFTVKVTDKNKATATKSYTVTVAKVATKTKASEYISSKRSDSKLSSGSSVSSAIVYTPDVPVNVNSGGNGSSSYSAELQVMSNDVLSQGTGRDEDLVSVRANEPVRFIIRGIVNHESEFKVYINDEYEESIIVSDEGKFTLPAEFVHDDFKVQVKAGEFESQELYISSEE